MKFSYMDLYGRNIGILSKEEQRKIKNTRVAVLGCGGGSEVAHQLVRTGFVNFILADFDEVALHNLNRQFYFKKDIGKNKALALEENLRLVNPDIKTKVLKKGINSKNISKIVAAELTLLKLQRL